MYYDKIYQKDMNKDSVIIRVLGQESVSTQLFGEGFMAETLRHISGTDSTLLWMLLKSTRMVWM